MIRLSSIFDHGVILRVELDRKSTRLNSSHANISYAVFCLKKKTMNLRTIAIRTSDGNDRAFLAELDRRINRRLRPDTIVHPCHCFLFLNDTATTEIYTLSLPAAFPI